MDDRKNKFNFMKEQIRNFITHCLGFEPDDMTGGEFSNEFTWKTNNSEFRIVAYYGCGWKKEPDYFDYYLYVDAKRTSGTYSFSTQLTCEDENAIALMLLLLIRLISILLKILLIISGVEKKTTLTGCIKQ